MRSAPTTIRAVRVAAAALCLASVLAACGGDDPAPGTAGGDGGGASPGPVVSTGGPTHAGHSGAAAPQRQPLRPGERDLELRMPADYEPAAPSGGTDDYRCFLVDPEVRAPTWVTGVEFLPGSPDSVHHAILFRVPPGQVGEAQHADDAAPGQGWTCFGDAGIPSGQEGGGPVDGLDSAPWLAGWAPGSGETVFGAGTGMLLQPGSRVILQTHYNLVAGNEPDRSGLRLRLIEASTPAAAGLVPLETMLLPAPVELPCAAGQAGPLCDREAAVLDVVSRFGADAGRTVAGLQLLCAGISLTEPPAGPTQSCDRRITQTGSVRAVAGHMHLRGSAIRIELNPGTPSAATLLDRAVWNFDDQAAEPLPVPVAVVPGDVVRVTCTHDATLADRLPALQEQESRYVVWGEGTTDEMCLGIVLLTRS